MLCINFDIYFSYFYIIVQIIYLMIANGMKLQLYTSVFSSNNLYLLQEKREEHSVEYKHLYIYIYIYIYIYLYTLFGLWMFVTSTECSTLRVNISCLKKRSLNTTKVSYRFISIYLSTYIYQVLASHAGDSLCPRSHPRK